MPESADGRARVLVEHRDRHRLALRGRAGVLPDQDARVEVVGCEQRVGRRLRDRRGVERDHEHASLPRLGDRRILRLPVGDGDEDPLHPRGRHVLDCGDLARVVGARLARRVDQLRAELLRLSRRALVHLHEERVRRVLRDQPDLDRRARRRGLRRCRCHDGGHDGNTQHAVPAKQSLNIPGSEIGPG